MKATQRAIMKKNVKVMVMTVFMLVMVMLVGCVTKPPNEKIATAEFAIQAAQESQASEYASLELRYAKDNLQKAKEAVEMEDYKRAERLAELALTDARLAEAKAESIQARGEVARVKEDIQDLTNEINRLQGNY